MDDRGVRIVRVVCRRELRGWKGRSIVACVRHEGFPQASAVFGRTTTTSVEIRLDHANDFRRRRAHEIAQDDVTRPSSSSSIAHRGQLVAARAVHPRQLAVGRADASSRGRRVHHDHRAALGVAGSRGDEPRTRKRAVERVLIHARCRRDVLAVDVHQEPAAAQRIERAARIVGIGIDLVRDVGRGRTPEPVRRVPHPPLGVGEHAHDLDAVGQLQRQRQPVTLEHRLDRVPMVLGHAAEDEVRVLRRIVRDVAHQELGDDFVRA